MMITQEESKKIINLINMALADKNFVNEVMRKETKKIRNKFQKI